MNSKRMFIGDIKEVTKFEIEQVSPTLERVKKEIKIQKKDTVLVKARNKKYLELEKTKSFLNQLGLYFTLFQGKDFIDEYHPVLLHKGFQYIHPDQLKPYITRNEEPVEVNVSLKMARKIQKRS